MSLRKKLLEQGIKVILITMSATLIAGFIYSYVYENERANSALIPYEHIIIMQNNNIICTDNQLNLMEARDIIMNLKVNQRHTKINHVDYLITEEPMENSLGIPSRLIRLRPINTTSFPSSFLLLVTAVFIVTFLLSYLLVISLCQTAILNPIVSLTATTNALAKGELDNPVIPKGYGQVLELYKSVERLRVKLKESDWLKTKYETNRSFLISSISHDLRTPVTAIRGYIEGVLEGVADTPSKQQKYLISALHKISAMHLLIEDLLLYSKLDSNQMQFNMEKVDIYQYMLKCVTQNELGFINQDKGLKLISSLTDTRYVLIDTQRFARVMQNILDNAARYISPNTGQAVVSLRETSAAIIIQVKDNGPGIKREDLERVFDKFYKADTSRENSNSSGLGLAIAKQLVHGMNGQIWVTSPPDQGACISVSFKKI